MNEENNDSDAEADMEDDEPVNLAQVAVQALAVNPNESREGEEESFTALLGTSNPESDAEMDVSDDESDDELDMAMRLRLLQRYLENDPAATVQEALSAIEEVMFATHLEMAVEEMQKESTAEEDNELSAFERLRQQYR